MAKQTLIDTHVAVWLFYGQIEQLSKNAQETIENFDLLLSPVSLLEIEYLREIKKISHDHNFIFSELAQQVGLALTTASMAQVIHTACPFRWTRDPFGRMIAAEAKLLNAPILTKDRLLAKHVETIW